MAVYASLVSLAKTTTFDINHVISDFSINAKDNIRSIHVYVIILLTFLEDYPKGASRWEGKLRDIAHEAEDIIEQFMWRLSFYGGEEMSSRLNFEKELGSVTEKFCLIAGDVMDERPAYSSPSLSSAAASRVAAAGNGVVIGLNEDVMAIKERLCGLSSKLQVVPISGMGGIGKTTLATTVFDDPLIMCHFHIRVWLTISQDYNAQKVLLDLVASMNLIEKQMSKLKMDDTSILTKKVYQNLKGRRYLVVMDDVWSTKVWDDVRNVFPDDGNGSRIMLTTRLEDVAVYPDPTRAPHKMRFMNDDQSWDLLQGKVFADSDCPHELEDVGKKIARNCGGLPLAVVLVAGFLSEVNENQSSWEEVSKNVINPVVGQELEGILSLSYTHLPHHLRPCFLFMAMFPEDENICASKLIRLWLAEGFLKHQNRCNRSMEEEAEDYLEDLVKRNLVTVTRKNSEGKIKHCSLHDMVRDLCIRKARDERFLRVIDEIFHHVIDGRVVPENMINERRISLWFSDFNVIRCPTIHTMLCFRIQSRSSLETFIGHSRLLRILNVVSETSEELLSETCEETSEELLSETCEEPPSQVFELFHLRYLTFICSYSVPPAISNLVNLQTLIILPTPDKIKISKIHQTIYGRKMYLRTSKTYFSLPLEIWSMPQLRHLISHCPCILLLPHPPYGPNPPLENIQTLTYIKDLVWTEKILQMIPNVKRLDLVYQMDQRCNLHLLMHLHHLQKLEIYVLGGFPWMKYNPFTLPRTLKKLTLRGGRFLWQYMSIIGSLPNLQVLKLIDQTSGETWVTADGEFPQLRYLLIERSDLKHWITESSHFPILKRLVLRLCEDLMEIPQDIGFIPTLELIEVDPDNCSLVESAKQIAEDQQSYGNYDLRVRVSYY